MIRSEWSSAAMLVGLLASCAANQNQLDRTETPHQVLLQLRAGAGGGNPNRIDMNGSTSIYVDRFSTDPLSFDVPVTMQ